jgi:hypothetical protein
VLKPSDLAKGKKRKNIPREDSTGKEPVFKLIKKITIKVYTSIIL